MKKVFLLLIVSIYSAIAAPGYICTARSGSGRPYRAKGVDKESTMLQALQACEANHFRCVRSGCVVTDDVVAGYDIVGGYHTGWAPGKNHGYGVMYFHRYSFERLPDSYDFEALYGASPVRDQGSCGSCWAFGTAQACIGAQRKAGSPYMSLSEGQIKDCAPWDKCSGGLFSGGLCVNPGLTDNAHYPYVPKSQSCHLGSNPIVFKGMTSGLVGKQGRKPTTDEMRQAMIDYGVLTVTVNATNALANYKSGIFRRCSGGQANHEVAVVKFYPDPIKPGKYVWRVKNSWGEKFGDKGYIDMPEGCNSLGYDETGFVTAKNTPVTPPSVKLPSEVVVHLGDEVILTVKEETGVDYKWTNQAGTVLSQKAQVIFIAVSSDVIHLSAKNAAGEATIMTKITVIR